MKTSFFKSVIVVLFPFFSFGQLSATVSGTTSVCVGDVSPLIIFSASGGTAPYVFHYQINGGPTEVISTNVGESDTLLMVPSYIAGTYIYTLIMVEDATSSEIVNESVMITIHPLPVVFAGTDLTTCSGGVISLTALGGPAGVIYLWDNGVVDGIPFTINNTTTFTVTAIDLNGCQYADQLTVTVMPSTPPAVTAVIDSSECTDGSILLTINGNLSPYSVLWSNGATTAINSPLASGNYTAFITDSMGCTHEETYTVPASLSNADCGTISGFVHYDSDLDCLIGQDDVPILNRMITVNPGNYTVFTDQDGYYELHLTPGNYTIEESFNNTNIGAACNPSHSISLTTQQTIDNLNFMDTISGGFDFQAHLTVGEVRPMFPVNLFLNISEIATTLEINDLSAWFTIPNGIILTGWSHPHTVSNDTVYFQISNGNSVNGTAFLSHVNLYNQSAALGSIVTFCIGIEEVNGETNLSNNVFCQNEMVIGSYDPNDITLFLNGNRQDSTILLADEILDYRIRFQNTGTADAINVYVLDTISNHLDFSSFQLISTSHLCELSVLDGNVLKFYFPLIHLPDSATNEPESHGYINYRIRQKAGNQVGDIILNTAYIYFDFNEAVVTNTAYNRIVEEELSVHTPENNTQITIYPNPGKNEFTISGEMQGESISITVYDAHGKSIHQEFMDFKNKTGKLQLDLNSGIYFLNIGNPQTNEQIVKKLVVL